MIALSSPSPRLALPILLNLTLDRPPDIIVPHRLGLPLFVLCFFHLHDKVNAGTRLVSRTASAPSLSTERMSTETRFRTTLCSQPSASCFSSFSSSPPFFVHYFFSFSSYINILTIYVWPHRQLGPKLAHLRLRRSTAFARHNGTGGILALL